METALKIQAKRALFLVLCALWSCDNGAPQGQPTSASEKNASGNANGGADGSTKCAELHLAGASKPNWDDDVEELVERACGNCHGDGGQEPILSSFDRVKKKGATVAKTVANQSMPPRDSLEEGERELIANWAAQGFRENADDKVKPSTSQEDDEGLDQQAADGCE